MPHRSALRRSIRFNGWVKRRSADGTIRIMPRRCQRCGRKPFAAGPARSLPDTAGRNDLLTSSLGRCGPEQARHWARAWQHWRPLALSPNSRAFHSDQARARLAPKDNPPNAPAPPRSAPASKACRGCAPPAHGTLHCRWPRQWGQRCTRPCPVSADRGYG
jgi:hypothetical protein